MPRVALSPEQKRKHKTRDLIRWVSGRMRSLGLRQEDVARKINISQGALSVRLNPKTYERNRNSDPFSFGELLVLFDVLEATPEEKQRLMTL